MGSATSAAPTDQMRNAMRPQSRGSPGATEEIASGSRGTTAGSSADSFAVAEGDMSKTGAVSSGGLEAAGVAGSSTTRHAGSDADNSGSASMAAIATNHTRWRVAADERRQPTAATPARRIRGAP